MKNIFKIKTLRGSLIFYQVLLIGLILLIAGSISYVYISRAFIKMILIEQNSLGSSIAKSLGNELDKMNVVSMNISYSNLIKDMFKEYKEYSNPDSYPVSKVKKYNNQTLLFDSILGIMGPFNNVSQVNLYTFDGFMVGSGLFNEETLIDINQVPKLKSAIKLDGYKYITTPEKSEFLARKNMHLKDHSFISLIRVFKDQHHQNEGIVEVQQDCETIFSSIGLQEETKNSLQAYVIDSNSNILYPYGDSSNLIPKFDFHNIESGNQSLNLKGSFNGKILTAFEIENYNLKLLFLQSRSEIISPVTRFQILFFIFLAVILIYTFIVSYSVSSSVTKPLNSLVTSLSELKLNNLSLDSSRKFEPKGKHLMEIDSLNSAFSRMFNKLQRSLNELIALKDQEALTRLLTLQSQMNPHFLYNNLSILSILAEEGKSTQVVAMCKDISDMLRYSNKKSPGGASIKEEIDYVDKYLACMTLRYEDDLEFYIKVPKEMNEIRIPRILIQPLVENSINHGFTTEPVWKIYITGKIVENRWYITVKDNGCGFSEKIITKYSNKNGINCLASENLGIENTRQRLNLIYKDSAFFKLGNNIEGGAFITIGGNLNYYEDRYEG